MGHILFKKYLKFQNFDEIFYCDMIGLRNTYLDVFIQCQCTMYMDLAAILLAILK